MMDYDQSDDKFSTRLPLLLLIEFISRHIAPYLLIIHIATGLFAEVGCN